MVPIEFVASIRAISQAVTTGNAITYYYLGVRLAATPNNETDLKSGYYGTIKVVTPRLHHKPDIDMIVEWTSIIKSQCHDRSTDIPMFA